MCIQTWHTLTQALHTMYQVWESINQGWQVVARWLFLLSNFSIMLLITKMLEAEFFTSKVSLSTRFFCSNILEVCCLLLGCECWILVLRRLFGVVEGWDWTEWELELEFSILIR